YFANRILTHIEAEIRAICIDFTGEWARRRPHATRITDAATLNAFLTGSFRFGLIELPSASNTDQTIERLADIMEAILDAAKRAYAAGTPFALCLVLEEAHTIVPEQNFLGVNSFDAKPAVNKIAQLALQGRKYRI